MSFVFILSFLAASLIIIVAAVLYFQTVRLLPVFYEIATHLEHLWLYRSMQREALDICRAAGKGKIIDIGSGTGFLALPASKIMPTVALDASREMLRFGARKAGRGALTSVVGMAESLPFEARTFEVVLSSFSLHHFSNLTLSLREMMRVVREGGHIVLLDIGAKSFFSEIHRIVTDQVFRFLSGQGWQGCYYLDFDVLKQWLINNGCLIHTVTTYPHLFPRQMIHATMTSFQAAEEPLPTVSGYGSGVGDEAKAMMLQASLLEVKKGNLTTSKYIVSLLKPFLEVMAGNLYLSKRLLLYGSQHFLINVSERFINRFDAIGLRSPRPLPDAREATRDLKEFARRCGADLAGVMSVDKLPHSLLRRYSPFAERMLVIARNTLELEDLGGDVWEVYTELSSISNKISNYIRKRYQFSAQAMFPFSIGLSFQNIAWQAGLGCIGWNNLLVNRDYGAKVRFSVVITDMPLTCDSLFESDLCRDCKKYCHSACPAKAISKEGYDMERCLQYFRQIQGCGLCATVCRGRKGAVPYSIHSAGFSLAANGRNQRFRRR